MTTSQKPRIHLHPVNWVQRIALYVTKGRYYLVGSNNTQTVFKVLKIDRTEEELSFVDDRIEYTYQEICDLLMRIGHGNRTPTNPSGLTKTVCSFGIIGFVRFLHGYYIILIIKRRKVASIGYHTIYKVEETKLVYIPNKQPTEFVNEEARYVKAFNSIDLNSNFYYSYSYDISHSLQYNLSPIRGARFLQPYRRDRSGPGQIEEECDEDRLSRRWKPTSVLIKTKPCYRFVWNSHLIDFDGLHDDWKIYLCHGFVAQANICVYSKPVYITIIARRSRLYSGTRFLKRGLNMDGDCANEVETEQIVFDSSVSDFSRGYFTSFVQLRGSLPERWSQDVTKMVPKPPIKQDFVDPYHEPTAKHFNDLLKRYGTPIVVLNLIKHKEKKAHESVLNGMLQASVDYLNQFLPRQHVIRLINFDMARCNKSRNENVMQRLGKIGFNIVRVTGIFQSWRSARKSARKSNHDNTYTMHLRQRTFNRKPSSLWIEGYRLRNGQCLQNGVVRVNCVDSLDRTNTAQFVLGKVALAFQLQALGVLIEPKLDYDTDAVRLLEQLYEDHGDTIALQYGGSQLVHRVKTYRKVAPITSHSSEIMQALSRYYSNTFSDAEKQNVINIFLGIRQATRINVQEILSNLITDYYLHNQLLLTPFDLSNRKNTYKQWWDRNLLKSLPRAYNEHDKESNCYALELWSGSETLEQRIDYYSDAYRPYEITILASSFSNQILHTLKDFMPNSATNHSPFCLRLAPGKLKEKYLRQSSSKRLPPNPSVYGLPSTSSSNSDISLLDSDIDDDDQSDLDDLSTHPTAMNTSSSMKSTYPNSREQQPYYSANMSYPNNDFQSTITERKIGDQYGCMTLRISVKDLDLYDKYTSIGCNRETDMSSTADMIGAETFASSEQENNTLTLTKITKRSSFEFAYQPLSEVDLMIFLAAEATAAASVEYDDDDQDGDRVTNLNLRVGNELRRGSWSESPSERESSGYYDIRNPDQQRRRVRDQFNFYNYRQPPSQQPYNVRPYDDAEDLPRPRPYPYPLPQPFVYPYPYPYPYPPPTTSTSAPTTPSTTTTTTPAGPINPIGYMLIDTYNSPRGSFSRPIAFFKSS